VVGRGGGIVGGAVVVGGVVVVGGAVVVVVLVVVLARCTAAFVLFEPPRVAMSAPAVAETPTTTMTAGIHSQRRRFMPSSFPMRRRETYLAPQAGR
jgi:hypothetical protein